MSEANTGNVLPDEALALANAMALRAGQSQVIAEQILAGLQGVSYEAKTPEELRGAHLGRTVLFLAKVESPDATISWGELVDATNANGGYEKTAQGISEDAGAEVRAEGIRGLVHAVAGEIRDNSGQTDEKMTKDFAKTLASAREVAADHGTDVANVYATDDLYYEASRRAFEPSEMADELSRIIDSFSGDMLSKVLVQQLENMLPKEMLDQVSQEELAEMAVEMQLDPQVQAGMAESVELFKEAMRQSGTFLFTRTYGVGAIHDLSTAHKLALMPRKPLVAEVFDTL